MAPAPSRDWIGPALVLSLLVLPWTVLTYGGVTEGSTTLLFAWGLVDPATTEVTGLHTFLTYTRGLPDWLLAWPVGVGCLVAALASVAVGVARGRGDVPAGRFESGPSADRLTAALLALLGVAVLSLTRGFSVQPGRTGVPLGTVLAWVAAIWYVLQYRAAAS